MLKRHARNEKRDHSMRYHAESGMSPVGKKSVASDEWLVARNNCNDSRGLTEISKPRPCGVTHSWDDV